MTVSELSEKLSSTEYFGWLEYLKKQSEQQAQEPGKPNLLDSPDNILKGFGF